MKKSPVPDLACQAESIFFKTLLAISLVSGFSSALPAAGDPFTKQEPPPLAGRWDLTVRDSGIDYPSWLEVELSGYRTLVGRYVGQFGSARPIGNVEYDSATGSFRFELPPQWERRTNEVVFRGRLSGDALSGETTDDQGHPIRWEARRAPSLNRNAPPKWGRPVKLFNGRDLTGWKPRNPDSANGWRVAHGSLTNAVPGNDLLTTQTFNDFKLRVEFRYPKGSNSGIYLRGRYEVQIEDDYGLEPTSHRIGGVYGFLTPRINASRRPGEWQALEITLVGRVVTIVLNGEPIIERQTIPGITGGALDSHEAEPGPILIQGDHGPVEFRTMVLTPAK